MGQTDSNYSTAVASIPTLNFFGTAGSDGYGSRTRQLCYTTGNFSIALEDPQAQLASDINDNIPEDSQLPNNGAVTGAPALSLRYEDSSGPFSYSVAAIGRELKYDDGENKDDAMGYAGFIATSYTAGPRGIVHATEGANSYLYLSGNYFNGADAYLDANGKLQTLSGEGGAIGVSLNIAPGYTVNTSYGYTNVSSGEKGVIGNAGRKNQNAFINLMWEPGD